MQALTRYALAALLGGVAVDAAAACPDWLDQSMRKLRSSESINFCEAYAGQPILFINTASHCGYTKQFKTLEALYQRYKDRGLVLVGVPSDSFRQEADTEAETAEVCYVNYGVTFTMTETVDVTGDNAHPLFKALNAAQGEPRWNFNKYLVDRDGNVVAHFSSKIQPLGKEISTAIEKVL
ncbi:MAG: glutathione peroxidase [Spongiibacteraceae bacterium]|jgi:glutathione peroxidase|nr:glutathione peroxidase [Spongiibacteraceae bacterium]